MKKLDKRYVPQEDYRELFCVSADSMNCTCEVIGLSREGEILFIKETLSNSGNAYYISREFFLPDREEFRHYLEDAGRDGELEKALKNGYTTMEELKSLLSEDEITKEI